MADWSPDTRNFGNFGTIRKRLEVRHQNRLADFVRAQRQPDEQIVAILSKLYGKVKEGQYQSYLFLTGTSPVAVAITNQQLIVVELKGRQPKKIVDAYPRDELTVELVSPKVTLRGLGHLTVANASSVRLLWFDYWMWRHAETVVLEAFGS